ncbi:ketoacyl-ACP synthase III [Bacteroidales bacterium OttesenSCG-928-L03]|nr:ketoacyl-ACP synthase III [Bacteroidales bacterium OttesenSCG-928-L03]
MALFSVRDIAIKGISTCIPEKKEYNISLTTLSFEEKEKLIATTGIKSRRITPKDICTSDLCVRAADQLLHDMTWNKDEIDILIFVTQTPDYVLPATSCLIQERLGLNKSCFTLDISLGCSGWIYGLSVLSSLLSLGQMKKGLLLAGDTISKLCSPMDKSTYPLFGDAGTCTAVEFNKGEVGFQFHAETDGAGSNTIIIPDGGSRNPFSLDSLNEEKQEAGIVRNKLNLILEGMDVFTFGISKAPNSINQLIEGFCIDKDAIDFFIFHQANLFMNEKIRKKLKLPEEKVPYSLGDFGNTSSATIPLTMTTQLRERLMTEKLKNIACGFGVGLSWGSVYFETDNIICPELIEI